MDTLPQEIVESLAILTAIEAASDGRLCAGYAISAIFQVGRRWRELSHSDYLWQYFTRRIWRRTHRLRDTWQEEFIYWHRTARNFMLGRYQQSVIPQRPVYSCLALSDRYLACGSVHGTVYVFDIETREHIISFHAADQRRYTYGPLVCGIIICDDTVTFARRDGHIYVGSLVNNNIFPPRAISGNVRQDGVMIDFTGTRRWWVGLFAGRQGRSFKVWDAGRLFWGGFNLTHEEQHPHPAWQLLASCRIDNPYARVLVTENEYVVACTTSRLVSFSLQTPEQHRAWVPLRRGFIVNSLDAVHDAFVVANSDRSVTVRRASTFEPLCRFALDVPSRRLRGIVGCINLCYVLIASRDPNELRAFDREHAVGQWRCTMNLGIMSGSHVSMVANQRHVVVSLSRGGLLVMDFGGMIVDAI